VSNETPHMFVVGFLFNPQSTRVCLILKTKGPKCVVGKFNGIGGTIEPDEDGPRAMVREFKEETGVHLPEHFWDHFATLRTSNEIGSVVVFFYRAFHISVETVRSVEEEFVGVHMVDSALRNPDLMGNLKWLIPLALDSQIDVAEVVEK
jgi:8-oxo-dGTP pyrophosphatase MutT (NUDIX family)